MTNYPSTNVKETERWASLISGGTLVAFGIAKKDWAGLGLAALGGGLLWRGATGHCKVYEAIGVNTSHSGRGKGTGRNVSIPYELGIRIDDMVRVNKPVADVYRFWRDLTNLPKFMDHLESVTVLENGNSRWVARGPAGLHVEWEAKVINQVENEVIGWRSLEGSDVDSAGSVTFRPTPDGSGTTVKVSLQYNPPAGALGAAVAKLFGQDPRKQVRQDLRCFRDLLERGSSSRKAQRPNDGEPRKLWDRDKVMEASEESFPASDPPSWTPERV